MGPGRHTEGLSIPSGDGITLMGKLDLPAQGPVSKLVVFVNGSGPNTCDNVRDKGDGTRFRFYDLFAEQFTTLGMGFFRYSTRGCTDGETPPFYCAIDERAYRTYGPRSSIRDLERWIAHLKGDPRLKHAKVYLLGWSEGTIIAPAVALRGRVEISALLLAGYANDTVWEILDWQQRGNSSLTFYRRYFDDNGDGVISREEFLEDRQGVASHLGLSFDELDQNGDGVLDLADFAALEAEGRREIFAAIERGDDSWLRERYPVPLTCGWFREHRALPPNRETLPKLEMPIHIFQGVFDASACVEGAYAAEKAFQRLGKTNLTVHIYEQADHNLGYEQYLYGGGLSQALEDIFSVCEAL